MKNHFYQTLDGWFDFAQIYDEAIRTAKYADTLVETGTWSGKSAAYLSVEAENSGKELNIYTIDIDKSKKAELIKLFTDNETENLEYICADSIKTASKFKDGTLHMIFLDSCHEYDFVRREIAAWLPKLKPGGIFAGHDYHSNNDVVRAVNDFCRENNRQVVQIGSSWRLV